MKNKVLIFIIGILVGAIISAVVFYVYTKSNTNTHLNSNQEFMRGERREMFENFENGGTPPEMPDGDDQMPQNMKRDNNNERKNKTENSSQEELEDSKSTDETI